MDEGLSIGKLASAAGLSVQAVRYYERRGLVPKPARRLSRYHIYDGGILDCPRTIRQAQKVGFRLEEIKELLRIRSPANRMTDRLRTQLQAKIQHIDESVLALQEMRAGLVVAVHANCDSLNHCTDPTCPF